jgi:hypothetical protein
MPMVPEGVDLLKLKAESDKVDWQQVAIEEEEEQEDLLGPVAPGQITRGYLKASMEAEQRAILDQIAKMEEEEAAKLPKHEGWMTMLPDVKALGFNLDDAQKNRTFLRKAIYSIMITVNISMTNKLILATSNLLYHDYRKRKSVGTRQHGRRLQQIKPANSEKRSSASPERNGKRTPRGGAPSWIPRLPPSVLSRSITRLCGARLSWKYIKSSNGKKPNKLAVSLEKWRRASGTGVKSHRRVSKMTRPSKRYSRMRRAQGGLQAALAAAASMASRGGRGHSGGWRG